MPSPIEVNGVAEFYVVFFTTRFASLDQVQREAPELLAEHVQTSRQLHRQGRLLMAGAFLDHPDEPLRTMAVAPTHQDAQHYAQQDPFLRDGYIEDWQIRRWANIFPMSSLRCALPVPDLPRAGWADPQAHSTFLVPKDDRLWDDQDR